MPRENISPIKRCYQPFPRLQRGITVMPVQPEPNALANRIMVIRNRKISNRAIDFRLFLAMTEVGETSAPLSHEPELPFRKGIASLEPLPVVNHFPATIET